MSRSPRQVLAVGLPATLGVALAAALAKAGDRLDNAATGEGLLRKARSGRFDLVLLSLPRLDMTLEQLVRSLRTPTCSSRTAALVVIAPTERMPEATAQVGRGVSRAFSHEEHPEIVVGAVFRLLEVGSPQRQRVTARLDLSLEVNGRWTSAVTEDLSGSGMLVKCPATASVGSRIRFRMRLPGGGDPVEGEVKVMRQVAEPDGTPSHLGVRFCTFDGDGRLRLGSHLGGLRQGSLRG